MGAAKRASSELDQLKEDMVARLKKADLSKNSDWQWDDMADEESVEWAQLGATMLIPLALKVKGAKGKPKERHLSVRFDLHRDKPEESAWEHATSALLVLGYWPHRDGNWSNQELRMSNSGRLRDENAWQKCGNHTHGKGRLLEWAEERGGNDWAQRAWTFGLPLKAIKNPGSVQTEIIAPLVGLLLSNLGPEIVLSKTQAFRWSTKS
jgi:hypothetical protein